MPELTLEQKRKAEHIIARLSAISDELWGDSLSDLTHSMPPVLDCIGDVRSAFLREATDYVQRLRWATEEAP